MGKDMTRKEVFEEGLNGWGWIYTCRVGRIETDTHTYRERKRGRWRDTHERERKKHQQRLKVEKYRSRKSA